MPRPEVHVLLVPVALLALVGTACAGALGRTQTNTPIAAVASPGLVPPAAPGPSPSPVRTASPTRFNGPTFILIRAPDITSGARLNFQGQGFEPSEQTAGTIGDAQGPVEDPPDPGLLAKAGDVVGVFVLVAAR